VEEVEDGMVQLLRGGGGAGGFRTSFPGGTMATGSFYSGGSIPVTVGAGGAGGQGAPGGTGNNGNPSIFGNITSTGGGRRWRCLVELQQDNPGNPGGSGGGGGFTNFCAGSGTGGTGIPPVSPPQGNPGGTGWSHCRTWWSRRRRWRSRWSRIK
jgi:hypothetical protein